jgi:anti-anti-sigma factor
MAEFKVEFSIVDKVVVVRTNGYLDDIGGKVFREQCTEYIDKGYNYFVFNLTDTPVINSSGLSMLLDLMVQVVDYNEGEVAITGLSSLTKTALRMTGVLTLCDYFPTEQEAVEAITP